MRQRALACAHEARQDFVAGFEPLRQSIGGFFALDFALKLMNFFEQIINAVEFHFPPSDLVTLPAGIEG
ncbi:MAG: hypothetical protein ACRCV9_04435, partial [Burkholderiaceae bacterium]